MSFMASARKNVVDIQTFLKDAASGNGIKYRAEKNAKHLIYIPVITEDGPNGKVAKINAISAKLHEGNDSNQKYYSYICLDGVKRTEKDANGNEVVVNSGNCPYCEAVKDAWDIYNIRMEMAKENNEDLEEAKKRALEELKIKKAADYMYIVVCQIKAKASKDGFIPEIDDETNLPAYETKVMKISKSKAEKLMKQAEDAGVDFAGAEIVASYPDSDDARILSGQVTFTYVIKGTKNTVVTQEQYAGLKEAMDKSCDEFDWDCISKAFPEWKGTTDKEAQLFVDTQFKQYYQYKLELASNPNAKYLEYVTSPGAGKKPELGNGTSVDIDPNAAFDPNAQEVDI